MIKPEEVTTVKEILSNWKDKKIDGKAIDKQFELDGHPLSWFYRPILFSGLLPPPFPQAADYLTKSKPAPSSWKCLAFRTSLRISDSIKQLILSRRKELTDSQKKILFLTFTNHANKNNWPFREEKIIPIIQADHKVGTYILGVDPLSTLSPKKLRHFSHSLYQYCDNNIITLAKKKSEQLENRWQKISLEQKRELFRYNKEEIYTYFQANLDFLYSAEFIFLINKYYYCFLQLLEKENIIAAVSSSQNNIMEKCLIAACHKKNIPVFVVQHGIALGYIPTLDPLPNVYFEIWGEKYKHDLLAHGVPAKQVQVTGPLIFDGIEKHLHPPTTSYPKIMLATSPLIEDNFMDKNSYFQKIKIILAEIKKLNLPLIIKPHPREKYAAEYLQLAQELGLDATLSSAQDRDVHYALISDCSLILTFGSTVALEAMIMGRPTITIKMFDHLNPANQIIINSGVTPIVSYQDSFAPIALSSLKNKQQKTTQFIENICSQLDGKSAERIVQNIYQKIKVKNSSVSVPSS